MSYELRCRMQKELDKIQVELTASVNKLRSEKGFDRYQKLKEQGRLISRKAELKEALRIMGQFER